MQPRGGHVQSYMLVCSVSGQQQVAVTLTSAYVTTLDRATLAQLRAKASGNMPYSTELTTVNSQQCTVGESLLCCLLQALPLAEFRSGQPVSAMAFLPGCRGCAVGYADGRLALFDLTAAGVAEGRSRVGDGAGVGVIRWSVVRHASPVISLTLHPSQPLLMSASR